MSPAVLRFINTFGYIGTITPAPGTWGSLAAVLLGWAISHFLGFWVFVAALVAVIGLGFYTVAEGLRDTPTEDPSEIVIDEVAGQWIALLFPLVGFWMRGVPMVWPGPVAAFLLFRLFDIWKPWLVGRADRWHTPAGVMLDDIIAGIFAGIVTIILAGLYHGVLMR